MNSKQDNGNTQLNSLRNDFNDRVKDKQFLTVSGENTFFSVIGQTPELAKVADIVAMLLAVTSIEQHWK